MNPFTYEALPSRVIFGTGTSRTQLGPEIAGLGLRRMLLIASERERPGAVRLTEPFAERVAGVFTAVRPHVPVELAEQARATARELRADGLLAIGGGSAIGTAKAIALETGLPIVAVPTTSAGSEMTPIYGLTSGQRKQTGRSLTVLPKLVLYDPELTRSLPASISGPSAMNAMAHCVEAFYAPGANPISTMMAEEGMRALARGALMVVAHPDELAGREQTLYGAYLAGAALAVAGTGLHHRLCHVLGGAYNLPHAELHSVILPHAVAFNEPAIPAIMAQISGALGSTAGSAAAAIFDLGQAIGAPTALSQLGLREEQLAEALVLVLAQLPAENPRPLDEGGVAALLTDAFWGRRPGGGGR